MPFVTSRNVAARAPQPWHKTNCNLKVHLDAAPSQIDLSRAAVARFACSIKALWLARSGSISERSLAFFRIFLSQARTKGRFERVLQHWGDISLSPCR
jgi:hypothetical protein